MTRTNPSAASKQTEKRPRLGLALGAGAARGMAHLGVLRELEEAGLAPDVVAGTSIGALVGGMYAAGKLDRLTEVALGLDWKQIARYFVEISFPRSGLIEGNKLTALLAEIVGEVELTELALPFRAVTTNLMTGEEVVISDGDLVEAIRASIAVPGIFTPARRGDDLLVDGGLVNPVPVSVCRTMGAERIIAVDLNYGRVKDTRARNSTVKEKSALASQRPNFDAGQIFEWLERNTKQFDIELPNPLKSWMERHALPNVFDVLGNTLGIIESQIAATRLQVDKPDLLIQPNVGDIRFMDFVHAGEMIEEGRRAAKEALGQWKENGSELPDARSPKNASRPKEERRGV
ncbi:MAG TPA: patatin-like phospholipase family protein [Aminobacteriaceae bacterium]|nr:patatin-like phospholipase family protein [Aminobacteriaceae bacterium]